MVAAAGPAGSRLLLVASGEWGWMAVATADSRVAGSRWRLSEAITRRTVTVAESRKVKAAH